jgi:2-methylisocitrate lyase-like PEP mutase family enzyme
MKVQHEKAARLRALHVPGAPLVLFNVWDVGSARAVAAAGAPAIGTSSWSVAAARGFADGERVPRAFALAVARDIVAGTDLPVTVDLESGYGESPDAVAETIAEAIAAGVVGANLEDSVPANGTLRAVPEQVDRLRAARRSADASGVPMFINARTDVFFQRPPTEHTPAMVADALERARAYADAGADGVFAPGLIDLALIADLAAASPLPVNVMVTDPTVPLGDLAATGVARISHGPMPYLFAMKMLEDRALAALAAIARPPV